MASNITIEFCTEDRARLDRLAELLDGLQPSALSSPDTATQQEVIEFLNKELHVPKQEEPQPEETPEPETPKATLADIQALVQKLVASHPSARDKVKKIVNTYSERVSTIPEDKFGEAMKRLTELGKELEG